MAQFHHLIRKQNYKMLEEKIYRLVAEYKIEEAFENLFVFLKDININQSHDEYRRDLSVLSASFHDLMHQKTINIINNNDAMIVSNRIVYGLLTISEKIFKSVEYKNTSTHLDSQGENYVLIHDTSSIENQNDLRGWRRFNTKFNFNNIAITSTNTKEWIWHLKAEEEESVGAHKFLSIKSGKVTYEYYPIQFNGVKDNLLFFMIPMKSNEHLIEVGSNIRDDPANGYSPFRIRKLANPQTSIWHNDEIIFDFSNTPEAKCSVFAFRINEGTPRAAHGEMLIKNIRIFEKR